MKLKFCGASKIVTGSSYFLTENGISFLIDSGLFQGEKEKIFNYKNIEFDPKELDFIIITHAHLDHCGFLPKLVKLGFNGPIYSTFQTRELSEVILRDSAKIQEFNNMKNGDTLLYDTKDVEVTLNLFKSINFNETYKHLNKIDFTFLPVGHILGAASVFLTFNNCNLLFSGDIGRIDQSIIKTFSDFDFKKYSPNYIVMESLYGGITHPKRDTCYLQLLNIIKETFNNNGSVYIPVFSIHRAQELLSIFKGYFKDNLINNDIKVIFDSPMGLKVTNIYKNNIDLFNEQFIKTNSLKTNNIGNSDYFNFQNLIIPSKKKRRLLELKQNKSIVLAGSGMADGGRIVSHLYKALENKNNAVIFVGFQAEGTLGRKLINGEKQVLINNEMINVKANIQEIKGFSAHADNEDLISWLNSFNLSNLKRVFLTHAEYDRILTFGEELSLKGYDYYAPNMYEEVEL